METTNSILPMETSNLTEVSTERADPHVPCPACEHRAWLEKLKGTALWLRLTTPPKLIEQLQR